MDFLDREAELQRLDRALRPGALVAICRAVPLLHHGDSALGRLGP